MSCARDHARRQKATEVATASGYAANLDGVRSLAGPTHQHRLRSVCDGPVSPHTHGGSLLLYRLLLMVASVLPRTVPSSSRSPVAEARTVLLLRLVFVRVSGGSLVGEFRPPVVGIGTL